MGARDEYIDEPEERAEREGGPHADRWQEQQELFLKWRHRARGLVVIRDAHGRL
jgi:hypothetical protein